MEDDPTAETDDGSTTTIGVLHVVYILQGHYALLFHPLVYGLPQAWRVHIAAIRAQPGDGFLNLRLVLLRATPIMRHLGKRGVGHLGQQDTAGQAVLYVVCLEALPDGPTGAQH